MIFYKVNEKLREIPQKRPMPINFVIGTLANNLNKQTKMHFCLQDVLGFWMDRGVDGFRMDAVPFLVEKDGLPDMAEGEPDPRQNQPGTYETIQSFRAYIDQYSDK